MGRQRKKYHSRRWEKSRRKTSKTDSPNRFPSEDTAGSARLLEVRADEPTISGRRIITISQLLSALNASSRHGQSCETPRLVFEKESRVGLRSSLLLRCESCRWSKWFLTDNEDIGITLPINESLVWGTTAGASHYESAKQMMTVMDIPFLSLQTYNRHLQKLTMDWDDVLTKQILENGKMEHQLALDANDFIMVGNDMYPCTSVYADGGWCTRSYGHSFKSKGGVAVVIGARSKKLLYVGIKNMYCVVCKRASNLGKQAENHLCYKNWDEAVSATAMETKVIEDGFRASITMHGLVFKTLIADGDSSVYPTLVKSNIYPCVNIQKAECINHVIKNLNKFLVSVTKATKLYALKERQMLKSQMHRIAKSLRAAVSHRSQESPRNDTALKHDIENILPHTFGQHQNCASYFCQKVTTSVNEVDVLRSTSLWVDVTQRMTNIASISKRLMPNLTSNICESFMNRVAKFNHGKRINVVQRGGWKVKASTSALSFNKGPCFYSDVFKSLKNKSPSRRWKVTAARTAKRLQNVKQRAKKKTKTLLKPQTYRQPDEYYGPNAADEDYDDQTVRDRVSDLMSRKQVTVHTQLQILKLTVLQSKSDMWITERQERITASNAGEIFSLKDSTNNSAIITKLLYPKSLSQIPSIRHGNKYEGQAIRAYERLRNVVINPCGLIVCLEHGILAASPDGLVGDEGIIEVKCPHSMIGYPVEEMPMVMKKSSFLEVNTHPCGSEIQLKKSHKYYKQIVMQLHVSGRHRCDFVVFSFRNTSKGLVEYPLFIQRIHRDESTTLLWKSMQQKLLKFYEEDLGPEIINSRVARSMPIKQPNYRLKAIHNARLQRKRKSDQKAETG